MAEISPLLAVLIVFVWPLFTGVCTWKYLRAYKAKKRFDSWIWFLAFAICVTVIEWWVLSVMMILNIII
jgi:hypothetical protein